MGSEDLCKVDDGVIKIFDNDDGDYIDKYEVKSLRRTDSEDVFKSVDGVVKIFDDDDERDYGDGIEDEGDCNDDDGFVEDDEDGWLNDTDKSDEDRREKCYTVLIEKDIRQQQQEDISQVSNTLLISTVSATILLRHYNWEVEKAHEAWFTNEEKVRKDVGLLVVVPVQNTETIIKCNVCFDDFARDDMSAANCGHLFCKSCWTQYISMKINDGPGCLMLRCPNPSCPVAVGQDMVNEFVSDEDKEKYSNYLYRSYVEDKRKMSKWCPGPGCECAIEFVAGSSNYDVVCRCGHRFCWNCVQDAHRPVDCDTVHKWVMKNSAESENVTWILANSKSCPRCKKPIQKNEGCMHMKCQCGFHFCWLCLGDWSTHGEKTGGFYACNIYEKVRSGGAYEEQEKIKNKAKDYLDKYAFYYERFEENQKSRLKAIQSLKKVESVDLAKLRDSYDLPETQLEFITDAWKQIIECRRVLKWTYAYGYYLPQSEHAKKTSFDLLQGAAESRLEILHQCAERELRKYLGEGDCLNPPPIKPVDMTSIKLKLLDLTFNARHYFEYLVGALENGLPDVGTQ
ncbi:probable E3 ubiquitin-protein ligase ARI8 [Papaver somniferum]|uniref:probable E3 ubiquitin-protein ligase ARI8 n=1 Tax=Papaver somniferum TaxID=3469 RepID=UPI000E6F5A44|nr:probable E3 ubiquitin-protein ligase ARI8 [Papaver somniferum]